MVQLRADDGRRESQMGHMWADTFCWQGIVFKTYEQQISFKAFVVVVVVGVPDYFWSRVSPFFQLSWNSHTPLLSVVGCTPIPLGLKCMLRVCLYRKGAMEWEKRGVGNIRVFFVFCFC